MKRPYKKKYRGNLFYYIFASFFIVILICTIIITFQYISYLDTANKNIENSYDSVALKAENNSDTYLSICYDFAEDLSEIKKEIADIADLKDINQNQSAAEEVCGFLFRIHNRMAIYSGTTSFIYLRNSDRVLTGENLEHDLYRDGILTGSYGLTEDDMDMIRSTSGDNVTVFLEKTDIMDFGRIMFAKEIYPDVVFFIGIPEAYLTEKLAQNYLPKNSQIILISENDVCFTSDGNPSLIGQNYSYAELSNMNSKDRLQIEEQEYFIYISKINDTDLYQLVLIPNTIRDGQIGTIVNFIIVSLIIWIILGGTFSILIANTLYKPVRNIVDKLPVSDDEKNNRKEFAVVDNAVSNLISKNKLYEKHIVHQNRLLSDSLFMRLLHGNIVMNPSVESIMSLSGFPIQFEKYVVVLIQQESNIDDQNGNLICDVQSENNKIYYLKHLYEKQLSSRQYSYYFVENYDFIAGIICFEPEHTDILSTLKDITVTIGNYLSSEISVFISQEMKSIYSLSDAYSQILQVEEYSLISGGFGKVTQYSNNMRITESNYPSSKSVDYANKLISCIQSGKYNDAILITKRIFSDMESRISSVTKYKYQISFINEALLLCLSDIEIPCREKVSDMLLPPLINESSLSNVSNRICGIISEIKNQTSHDNASRNKILEIASYIDENFSDLNLNANAVSEKFNISPSWLSVSFKKEMGINFLDYLHKKRIEKAKELIMNTDENISSIAEKVGYSNSITMYRVFKRYEGVAPGWYRQTDNSKK